MFEQFDVNISGRASEADRLEILARLDELAQAFPGVNVSVVGVAPRVTLNYTPPDVEPEVVEVDESDIASVGE